MKKIILAIALLSGVASAQACCYRGGYYHHGYYGGGGWVAPALVGGVIGYELANRPVIVEQPPVVYVQPQQPVIQAPPLGYHWQQMTNTQTGQLQIVLVPNQ